MSNVSIIILIIIVVIALIIGPLFMLDRNGRFNIPKGFENKQGYDEDEDDDWGQKNQQTSNSSNSSNSSNEHKTNTPEHKKPDDKL